MFEKIITEDIEALFAESAPCVSLLDGITSPVVGLCSMVELKSKTKDKENIIICTICSKGLNGTIFKSHLLSLPHMQKYAEKFHPEIHAKFPNVKKSDTKQFKLFHECMKKIEEAHGRGRPAICEENMKAKAIASLRSLNTLQMIFLLKKHKESKPPQLGMVEDILMEVGETFNTSEIQSENKTRPSAQIFLQNVGDANDTELHNQLSEYGDVIAMDVYAVENCILVQYSSVKEATVAVNNLSGLSINGKLIEVGYSEEKLLKPWPLSSCLTCDEFLYKLNIVCAKDISVDYVLDFFQKKSGLNLTTKDLKEIKTGYIVSFDNFIDADWFYFKLQDMPLGDGILDIMWERILENERIRYKDKKLDEVTFFLSEIADSKVTNDIKDYLNTSATFELAMNCNGIYMNLPRRKLEDIYSEKLEKMMESERYPYFVCGYDDSMALLISNIPNYCKDPIVMLHSLCERFGPVINVELVESPETMIRRRNMIEENRDQTDEDTTQQIEVQYKVNFYSIYGCQNALIRIKDCVFADGTKPIVDSARPCGTAYAFSLRNVPQSQTFSQLYNKLKAYGDLAFLTHFAQDGLVKGAYHKRSAMVSMLFAIESREQLFYNKGQSVLDTDNFPHLYKFRFILVVSNINTIKHNDVMAVITKKTKVKYIHVLEEDKEVYLYYANKEDATTAQTIIEKLNKKELDNQQKIKQIYTKNESGFVKTHNSDLDETPMDYEEIDSNTKTLQDTKLNDENKYKTDNKTSQIAARFHYYNLVVGSSVIISNYMHGSEPRVLELLGDEIVNKINTFIPKVDNLSSMELLFTDAETAKEVIKKYNGAIVDGKGLTIVDSSVSNVINDKFNLPKDVEINLIKSCNRKFGNNIIRMEDHPDYKREFTKFKILYLNKYRSSVLDEETFMTLWKQQFKKYLLKQHLQEIEIERSRHLRNRCKLHYHLTNKSKPFPLFVSPTQDYKQFMMARVENSPDNTGIKWGERKDGDSRGRDRGEFNKHRSRGGFDRPKGRGGYDRPRSRGGSGRPMGRGGYDRPMSRGGSDRAKSRGGSNRARSRDGPMDRSGFDSPGGRDRSDRSRSRDEYNNPRDRSGSDKLKNFVGTGSNTLPLGPSKRLSN